MRSTRSATYRAFARGHQVRQEVDPARLLDVVGVFALRELFGFHGRGRGGALFRGRSAEVHFVRLSRYFQNLESCSTSCCSVTGSLLRSRKSSREFLCRM